MRCYVEDYDLREVRLHQTNRVVGLVYNGTSFLDRVVGRVLDKVTRAQNKLMRMHRDRLKVVISERVVETALVFRYLRDNDKKILDFGSFESVLPLQMASLGYDVTAWDQRRYPFRHPNLRALTLDIFGDLSALEKNFDLITSISTIEHLGLGHYNDIVIEDADQKGVETLWNLLAPGGRLLVSVPAGRPAVQRGMRIYDAERIRHTFPMATEVRWFMKDGREGCWNQVDASEVQDLVYDEPLGQMPAEGVAFLVCDKA